MRSVAFFAVLLAFIFASSVVDARRPKWDELEGYTFDRYIADFGKRYATNEEAVLRRGYFEANLNEIKEHNKKPSSYRMNVNHMADWSQAELKRKNGARPHEMYETAQQLRSQSHVSVHKTSGVPLPDTVDWRSVTPSVVTAVKDQGGCGSCWAHGSVENIESYAAIATGNLWALSQQEVTACAPNPDQCGGTGGCMGSIAELAFDYVKNHGIAQEWSNPYTAYFGVTGNCSNSTSPVVWLDGYVKAPANDQEAVMDILAHTGPLSVNVDASQWNFYESGIYDGCHYAKNISIDHVVQLVGYGTDAGLKMDYWLIRNSWSPAFGENGYIRILRTKEPSCGWDVKPQDGTGCKGGPAELKVCGECGVLWDTSYPIVKK